MKKYLNGVYAVLATTILIAGSAEAKTRTYCAGGYTNGNNWGCFYNAMPLVSQNASDLSAWFPKNDASQSQLCVPTAAVMGLSAITMDNLSYWNGSWTQTKFVYKSNKDRIKAFMDLMGTSITGGTSGGGLDKYNQRADDIVNANRSYQGAGSNYLDDYRARADVWNSQVDVLNYGHWVESCAWTWLGNYSCSYNRPGGHEVTINGYYYDAWGNVLTRIYDPWYGVVTHRDISYLPNYTTSFTLFGIRFYPDNRPYGGNTTMIYRSGTAVKIIDRYDGIKTN